MYSYIIKQQYNNVCTHTLSNNNTIKYVHIHYKTTIIKQQYNNLCTHTLSNKNTIMYVHIHYQTTIQ